MVAFLLLLAIFLGLVFLGAGYVVLDHHMLRVLSLFPTEEFWVICGL